MERLLIVNADDFGLSEAVSRGILKAHHEGLVSSTTFMVNFPWAPAMAPLLHTAPNLGVGLHLNATTGAPVLPIEQVSSLVRSDGRFHKKWGRLMMRVRTDDVRREWSAQVERFQALTGRLPTHLDTHRYLQVYPPFTRAMLSVAKAYGIPAVRCLYPTSDMLPAELGIMGRVIRPVMRRSAGLIAASGLAHPTGIMAGDFNLDGLLTKLDRVSPGVTELVCHPGELDDRVRSLSSLQEQREVELAALTSQPARERLERHGIRLVTFGDLT